MRGSEKGVLRPGLVPEEARVVKLEENREGTRADRRGQDMGHRREDIR